MPTLVINIKKLAIITISKLVNIPAICISIKVNSSAIIAVVELSNQLQSIARVFYKGIVPSLLYYNLTLT